MKKAIPKRKRDYQAEYQRRIARGKAKGLSLSQARGHPKAGEKPVRKPNPIPDTKIQISLRDLRKGHGLAHAAKQIRVSSERLRNQVVAEGFIEKARGRWVIRSDISRQMPIFHDGEELGIEVSNLDDISMIGKYNAAVGHFLNTNDYVYIEPFIDVFVIDAKGRSFDLETDANALYRLAATGIEPFEQVYRFKA